MGAESRHVPGAELPDRADRRPRSRTTSVPPRAVRSRSSTRRPTTRVTGDTSWGSGCCLLFERAAFDQVGGFDPHYFPMYCDDVDVSWRLRLAGRRVVHAPRAAVFHDKRFDDGGGVEASEFAQYSSGLARMFLAHRYGRVDLADELLSWIDRAGSGATEAQRRAAAEFRERQARGDVPPLLAGAERVAQFVDGEYAVHRWTYGAASDGERAPAGDRRGPPQRTAAPGEPAAAVAQRRDDRVRRPARASHARDGARRRRRARQRPATCR